MEITEVRIKLMDSSEDRLRGFCSVTFDDCFVVRDLKIIEGNNGPFVAMPSRKLTSHCPKCRTKNHLRARFCNQCGARQKSEELSYDSDGRAKLYADIAHPVNAECREMIQNRVILELEKEIALSGEPGYISRYDDDYDLRIKQSRQRSGGGNRDQRRDKTSDRSDRKRSQDPNDSQANESSGKGSGTKESGAKDSGAKDSGAKDSGAKDSGTKDSGTKDSGAKESGQKDSGTKEPGTSESQDKSEKGRSGKDTKPERPAEDMRIDSAGEGPRPHQEQNSFPIDRQPQTTGESGLANEPANEDRTNPDGGSGAGNASGRHRGAMTDDFGKGIFD